MIWRMAATIYGDSLKVHRRLDRYRPSSEVTSKLLPITSWGGWRRSSGSGRRPRATTRRPWRSTSSSTTATSRPAPCTSWGWWRRSSGSGRQAEGYYQEALADLRRVQRPLRAGRHLAPVGDGGAGAAAVGGRPKATTRRPWRSTSSSTTATRRPAPTTSWGSWRRSSGSGRQAEALLPAGPGDLRRVQRPLLAGLHLPPVGDGGAGAAAVGGRPRRYYQQALATQGRVQRPLHARRAPTTSWGWWRRSSGSGRRPRATTSRPWRSRSSSTTATARPAPTTSWGWWRRSSGSGRRPRRTTSRPWRSTSSSTTATARRAPTTSWGWWRRSSGSGRQAEAYYQQALAIYVEFNDRYSQASTYHQLGMVAQEQRQWAAGRGATTSKPWRLYVEFNDRYSQASTYHQLGRVAQEQRQWAAAEALLPASPGAQGRVQRPLQPGEHAAPVGKGGGRKRQMGRCV